MTTAGGNTRMTWISVGGAVVAVKNRRQDATIGVAAAKLILGCALSALVAMSAHAAVQLDKIDVVDKRRPRAMVAFDRDQIERSGAAFLGDFLQNLPSAGGAENGLFNYGGSGASYLDLRNLGPGRTRILVDGAPFVSNGSGAVDLTTLPIAAVERVEIYYGTEALRWDPAASAGVVNIILVRDYDGWRIDFSQGQFQQGDGRSQRTSITAGDHLRDGHWGFIINHEQQEEVLAADRALSASTIFGVETISRGSSPNGSFLVRGLSPRFITLLPGRIGCAANVQCAAEATGDFAFIPSVGLIDAADREYLLTPTNRDFLYGWHSYDAGRFSLDSSIFWNRRSSAQQFVPEVLRLSGSVNLSAESIYNPFGSETAVGSFQPIDHGNRRNQQEVDTHRIAARAYGNSEPWNWAWNLQVSGIDSQTTRRNVIDNDALRLALGPSFLSSDGRPHCGRPDRVVEGCIPVNVLGGPRGFTPAMAAGIRFDEHQVAKSQLIAAQFQLGREVDVLDRSVQTELRLSTGLSEMHLAATNGMLDRTSTKNDSVQWLLDFPILPATVSESTAFEANINTGLVRGASFSPKFIGGFSLNVAPRSGPKVVLDWSSQLRAPTSAELEGARTTGVEVLGLDPCVSFFLPAAVQDRCTGGFAGLTPVFSGGRPSSMAPAQFGGNPDLQPERTKLASITMSWAPEPLPEWNFEVTGYRGRVAQPIALPSGRQLIAECYIDGELWACTRVSRSPSGQPSFDLRPINLPHPVKYSGADARVSVQQIVRQGVLSATLSASYLHDYRTRSIQEPGELSVSAFSSGSRRNALIPPNYSNLAGTYFDRNPFYRLRATLELGWQQHNYSMQLIGRWYSGLRESCDLLLQSAISNGDPSIGAPCSDLGASAISRLGENHIAPRLVADARFSIMPSARLSLVLGVRNIFDRDPDNSFSTIANSFDPLQGVPGRHIYFTLSIGGGDRK